MSYTKAKHLILDQTPHSLFWDVDGLGYICMGVATLFASFVFKRQGIEKLGQALLHC